MAEITGEVLDKGVKEEKMNVRLCDFRSAPGEHECLEAIWTKGRACKECSVKCYRAGMMAGEVSADNRKTGSHSKGAEGFRTIEIKE